MKYFYILSLLVSSLPTFAVCCTPSSTTSSSSPSSPPASTAAPQRSGFFDALKATGNGNGIAQAGSQTVPAEFPWMAHIRILHSRGESWCSGSLIARQWVLTAAHCVLIKFEDGGMEYPRQMFVHLGRHDILKRSEAGEQAFNVEQYHVHLYYNHRNFNSDLALLKLSMPAEITKEVSTIALPDAQGHCWSNEDYTAKDSEFDGCNFGIVTGWGVPENDVSSKTLKKARLDVRNFTFCQEILPLSLKAFSKAKMCAGGGRNGKDVCYSDSGSPFMCRNLQGKYHLMGVTSFGNRACSIAKPEPAVYARVCYAIEWINNTITGKAHNFGTVKAGTTEKPSTTTVDVVLESRSLRRAVADGNVDRARQALDRGAVVDLPSRRGYTALMIAAKGGNLNLVRFLVAQGADMEAVDQSGRSVLQQAADFGKATVVRFLISIGADASTCRSNMCRLNRNAKTARQTTSTTTAAAAWQSNPELDRDMRVAAMDGKANLLERLLYLGADVDSRTPRGYTALMLAARGNKVLTVQMLLQHGANVNARGPDGRTAADYAYELGYNDIYRLLVG